jgi:hypothetical protein
LALGSWLPVLLPRSWPCATKRHRSNPKLLPSVNAVLYHARLLPTHFARLPCRPHDLMDSAPVSFEPEPEPSEAERSPSPTSARTIDVRTNSESAQPPQRPGNLSWGQEV